MDESNYGIDAARERMKTKKMKRWAIIGMALAAAWFSMALVEGAILTDTQAQLSDTAGQLETAKTRLANLDENTVPRITEAYIGERYVCNDQGITNAVATDYVKNATSQTPQGLETIYRCMLDDGSETQFHVLAAKDGSVYVTSIQN